MRRRHRKFLFSFWTCIRVYYVYDDLLPFTHCERTRTGEEQVARNEPQRVNLFVFLSSMTT